MCNLGKTSVLYLGEKWYLANTTWTSVEELKLLSPNYKTKLERAGENGREEVWAEVRYLMLY